MMKHVMFLFHAILLFITSDLVYVLTKQTFTLHFVILLCDYSPVIIPYCFYNKLPQTWGFKTIQMYSLNCTFWRPEVWHQFHCLKPRCHQVQAPSESCRRESISFVFPTFIGLLNSLHSLPHDAFFHVQSLSHFRSLSAEVAT